MSVEEDTFVVSDITFHLCKHCKMSFIDPLEAEECRRICTAPKCPKCQSNQLMYGLKSIDTGIRPAICLECDEEFKLPAETPWVFDPMGYMIRTMDKFGE